MAIGDLPFADECGPVELVGGFVDRRIWGFEYLYRLQDGD